MVLKSRHLAAAILLGSVAPIALALPGVAQAQSGDQRSFSIPAQSLETALLAYMRQSGVQVGYEPGDVSGRQSGAVSGSMSAGEALSRLLGGSGLVARSTGGTSVRLQRMTASGDGATQLGPVRVQGAGGASSARVPVETATGPVSGYRATLTATATRTESAIRDVPQSIQIVPRQVIEDQAALRLVDVVQNVSSVQLNGTSGNRGDTYNIRAFETRRYAINGFMITSTMDRPETALDLANVERVEVLKGPSSVMVGLSEPGGVINIVTRAPTQKFSLGAAFQAGSFDFYRAELSVSGPLNASGTLTARATGALQASDGFREEARQSERAFGAAALRWTPDSLTQVDLTLDHADQKQPFDRGLIADDAGNYIRNARRYLGERWSVTGAQKTLVGLAAQRQVTPWLMLRFNGRYTDAFVQDRYGVDLEGIEDDGRTVQRRVTNRTEDSKDLTMRFDALIDAFTGGIEHRIMAGAEHGRGDFSFRSGRSNIASLDMIAPIYGITPLPTTRPNAAYDQDARTWAFYIQDQLTLGDKWKALAGVRYDKSKNFTDDIFNAEQIDLRDDAFTWRAGLVYQPTTAISIYGSYTQSFQPQEGQLIDLSPLEPETGDQYEAGVKIDVADRLSITGAVFQITKQNVATEDPTDPDFSILTGEQRVRGVEIDLSGEILPGWNMIANVSHLDAQITRDNVYAVGNDLIGIPKLSGRLWSTYTFPAGRLGGLTVGGGVRLVGKRQVDLENSYTIAGYETIDASVRYALNAHWEVSLNIDNLTNRFFIEGVQGNNNLYPGSPRRILGTVRARF